MWPSKPEDCIYHCAGKLTRDEADIAIALIDLLAWATAFCAVADYQREHDEERNGEDPKI